jgi:uncharacterized protein (DUF849 family)
VDRRHVLLKACLNGGRSRDDHPRVPLTAEELVADAKAVAGAGAGAVHVHPRRADGAETLEGDASAAVVEAIERATPDLPIGLTTGAWIEPDLERRLAAIDGWRARPDFASVNFSEEGAAKVARLLLDRGVDVEAGLATVEDARTLAESGLAERCLRVLVEVEEPDPAAAVEAAGAIEDALDRLGVDSPQLHHGVDRATWAVIEEASRRGHGVRIGLEDTLVLPDGRLARGNAELVEAAARLLGR